MTDSSTPTISVQRVDARKVRFRVEYPSGREYEIVCAPRDTKKLRDWAWDASVSVEALLAAVDRLNGNAAEPPATSPEPARQVVEDEDDEPGECIACGGTGRNSKGGPCICAGRVVRGEPKGSAPCPSCNGSGVEPESGEECPCQESGESPSNFRSTGDPVRDARLEGVTIPEADEPSPRVDYHEVMDADDIEDGSEDEDAEEVEPFRVRVRGRYQKAAEAVGIEADTPSEAFALALGADVGAELPVIEWQGTDRLACLDLDWHETDRKPDHTALGLLMARVSPWPAFMWRSHGGGLHLVYVEVDGFTARELAACAAICVRDIARRHGITLPAVEVLPRTAHPGFPRKNETCSDVKTLQPDVAALLRAWQQKEVLAADDSAVQAWLAERALEVGRRYPHDQCPFDPRPTSGGPPVVVFDDGVKCYVCEARGHRSGGYSSFGRLMGTYRNNRVLDAALAFTFFDQAQHLLREEYPDIPVPLLRPAWSAFLKLTCGDPNDPRVPRAMERFYVLRGICGTWLDARTLVTVTPRVDRAVTSLMPSAMFVDANGEAQVSARKHDLHRTNQSIPGFPEVVPIRGCKLWGVHNEYAGREVRSVIPSRRLDEIVPQYLPPNQRPMTEAAAWARVEASFPGVERSYIELLIALRAFAESGTGPVPMVLCTGPSGAAKSTSVWLAATICGDCVVPIKEETREKFSEALGERAASAGFMLLDEFAKDRHGSRARGLFNLLLDVGREYTYRRIYHGPTTAYINSVLVVTNNAYGRSVMENAQLGRRLVYVPLMRRTPARWEDTCGTRDVRYWRTVTENAQAADTILSAVVDRHVPLAEGPVSWVDVADRIGYGLLEEQRDPADGASGVNVADTVRELFTLVCGDAPDAPPRWKGRGWKLIDPESHDALSVAWRALCDDITTSEGWASSMAVAELDLAHVLNASEPVMLEVSRHGRRAAIRFVSGNTRGRAAVNALINGEIPTRPDAPPAEGGGLWEQLGSAAPGVEA